MDWLPCCRLTGCCGVSGGACLHSPSHGATPSPSLCLSTCIAAVYNNAQTLNLQRFVYFVVQQLRRVRRQVGAAY